MVRVAINGFGRIGRMVFRAGFQREDIEFVAVNDLTDTKTLAYLLKYDSAHGTLDADIGHDDSHIYVNGKAIRVHAERDPEALPWGELNIDVVIESTGFFRTAESAGKHLTAGAKRVIISAPKKGGDIKTIICGVNEHEYNREEHKIISNASCTSNSLAPMVKVIHDNFGIDHGFFTTVHSITGDQRHVDGPHKDLRRGRACGHNIVPTSSGAAFAVVEAIPELEKQITGMAYRVPTLTGSVTEFTCQLHSHVTVEQVNNLFRSAAEHHFKGIMKYSEEALVSSDIVDDPHSCIFDASLTEVIDGKLLRVVGWYDNEWGYSNRIIELL